MRKIVFIILVLLCQVSSAQQSNVNNTTIASHSTELEFQIYPNPVNGNFFIVKFDFSAQQYPDAELKITNVLGQLVYTHNLDKTDYINKSIRIDLADFKLEKGVYFLKLSSGDDSRLQKIAIR